MMKLLFIRHAESVGNLAKRMQGQADFELSSNGKVQAKKLARCLMAEAWWPSYIYSSPLKRAVQTTQVLIDEFRATSGDLNINVEYAEALQELHAGIFQGLTWAEALILYPELCHQLETSLELIPIPGAESLQQARVGAACPQDNRANQFIQTLLARHTNTDQVWIVAHGGILQYLVAELLGCDRTWGLQIDATALFEFWIDRSRWHQTDQNRSNTALWQIRRFNDSQHLHL